MVIALSVSLVSAKEFKEHGSLQGAQIDRVSKADLNIELPRFIFSHTNSKVVITFKDPSHDKLSANGRRLHFIVNGNDQVVEFDADGKGSFLYTFVSENKINILYEDAAFNIPVSVIPVWYMILPLVALFVFLGYRLVFTQKKLKVVHTNKQPGNEEGTGRLEVVREEEEALA